MIVEGRNPLEWEHPLSCSTFVPRAHSQRAVNSIFFEALRRVTACLFKIESARREIFFSCFSPAFVLLSLDKVTEEAYTARLLSEGACRHAFTSIPHVSYPHVRPAQAFFLPSHLKFPSFIELKREMAVPGDAENAAATRTGN